MEQVDLKKLGIVEIANPKISPEFVCDFCGKYNKSREKYVCSKSGLVKANFCNRSCRVRGRNFMEVLKLKRES